MESFCDSDLWDSNLTWTSGVLEFTTCFQDTVLVWTPLAVLWLSCGIDFHYIKRSRYQDISWNSLNIFKTVILIALIGLSLIDLIFVSVLNEVFIVSILNPILYVATFVSIL